jgi:hypothetical protein
MRLRRQARTLRRSWQAPSRAEMHCVARPGGLARREARWLGVIGQGAKRGPLVASARASEVVDRVGRCGLNAETSGEGCRVRRWSARKRVSSIRAARPLRVARATGRWLLSSPT